MPPTPNWKLLLATTVALQSIQSFHARVVPILSTVLAAHLATSTESIGRTYALVNVGTALFLLFGLPVLQRWGSFLTLQASLVLAGIAVAGMTVPSWTLLAISCLLLGVSYGPTPAAATDLIMRFTPTKQRSLIFSLKQSGVPIGGGLAGLVIPLLSGWMGWQGALILLGVCSALAALPLTRFRHLDETEERGTRLGRPRFLSLRGAIETVGAVLGTPALAGSVVCYSAFNVVQSAFLTFQAAWLILVFGLDLTAAGALCALTQAASIIGRPLFGWLADELGPRPTLAANAILGALTVVGLGLLQPASSLWLVAALCAVAGLTVMSWNGLQFSEVARLAAPGKTTAATNGFVTLMMPSLVLGPLLFSGLLTLGLGFGKAFLCLTASYAVALAANHFVGRHDGEQKAESS